MKAKIFPLNCIDLPPQYMNGVWVPDEKQRTKATFLSSKALDCTVPSLSNTAVNTEDFMMDDKPYARWEIKVKLSLLFVCWWPCCQKCSSVSPLFFPILR